MQHKLPKHITIFERQKNKCIKLFFFSLKMFFVFAGIDDYEVEENKDHGSDNGGNNDDSKSQSDQTKLKRRKLFLRSDMPSDDDAEEMNFDSGDEQSAPKFQVNDLVMLHDHAVGHINGLVGRIISGPETEFVEFTEQEKYSVKIEKNDTFENLAPQIKKHLDQNNMIQKFKTENLVKRGQKRVAAPIVNSRSRQRQKVVAAASTSSEEDDSNGNYYLFIQDYSIRWLQN